MTDDKRKQIIEEIDPDWKDHFLFIETAWEFYKGSSELNEAIKRIQE